MNTLYSIQMQNVSNFDEHTQRKWIIKRVQERKRLFARTVCVRVRALVWSLIDAPLCHIYPN